MEQSGIWNRAGWTRVPTNSWYLIYWFPSGELSTQPIPPHTNVTQQRTALNTGHWSAVYVLLVLCTFFANRELSLGLNKLNM